MSRRVGSEPSRRRFSRYDSYSSSVKGTPPSSSPTIRRYLKATAAAIKKIKIKNSKATERNVAMSRAPRPDRARRRRCRPGQNAKHEVNPDPAALGCLPAWVGGGGWGEGGRAAGGGGFFTRATRKRDGGGGMPQGRGQGRGPLVVIDVRALTLHTHRRSTPLARPAGNAPSPNEKQNKHRLELLWPGPNRLGEESGDNWGHTQPPPGTTTTSRGPRDRLGRRTAVKSTGNFELFVPSR